MGEKSVLVTGATGFLGQHTVSALRNDGWHVTRGVRQIPKGVSTGYIQLDLDDPSSISRVGKDFYFDAVVHLGAKIGWSGEGFVPAAAIEKGWDVIGVDYQTAPVEKFNPVALACFTATDPSSFLESCQKNEDLYDVIILQNVLEHVRDPEALLATLSSLLAHNGILLTQIPNDFSALQSLAKEKAKFEDETWFVPPQHLTYWNSDNIEPYM